MTSFPNLKPCVFPERRQVFEEVTSFSGWPRSLGDPNYLRVSWSVLARPTKRCRAQPCLPCAKRATVAQNAYANGERSLFFRLPKSGRWMDRIITRFIHLYTIWNRPGASEHGRRPEGIRGLLGDTAIRTPFSPRGGWGGGQCWQPVHIGWANDRARLHKLRCHERCLRDRAHPSHVHKAELNSIAHVGSGTKGFE